MKSSEISFSSKSNFELINITDKVQKELGKMNVKDGLLHFFAPHATGVLLIAEDEEGLKQDMIEKFEEIFPKRKDYHHQCPSLNAHSHLMSATLGCDLLIPVRNGEMQLGTWQSIFFLETDGPRSGRKIIFSFLE